MNTSPDEVAPMSVSDDHTSVSLLSFEFDENAADASTPTDDVDAASEPTASPTAKDNLPRTIEGLEKAASNLSIQDNAGNSAVDEDEQASVQEDEDSITGEHDIHREPAFLSPIKEEPMPEWQQEIEQVEMELSSSQETAVESVEPVDTQNSTDADESAAYPTPSPSRPITPLPFSISKPNIQVEDMDGATDGAMSVDTEPATPQKRKRQITAEFTLGTDGNNQALLHLIVDPPAAKEGPSPSKRPRRPIIQWPRHLAVVANFVDDITGRRLK